MADSEMALDPKRIKVEEVDPQEIVEEIVEGMETEQKFSLDGAPSVSAADVKEEPIEDIVEEMDAEAEVPPGVDNSVWQSDSGKEDEEAEEEEEEPDSAEEDFEAHERRMMAYDIDTFLLKLRARAMAGKKIIPYAYEPKLTATQLKRRNAWRNEVKKLKGKGGEKCLCEGCPSDLLAEVQNGHGRITCCRTPFNVTVDAKWKSKIKGGMEALGKYKCFSETARFREVCLSAHALWFAWLLEEQARDGARQDSDDDDEDDDGPSYGGADIGQESLRELSLSALKVLRYGISEPRDHYMEYLPLPACCLSKILDKFPQGVPYDRFIAPSGGAPGTRSRARLKKARPESGSDTEDSATKEKTAAAT